MGAAVLVSVVAAALVGWSRTIPHFSNVTLAIPVLAALSVLAFRRGVFGGLFFVPTLLVMLWVDARHPWDGSMPFVYAGWLGTVLLSLGLARVSAVQNYGLMSLSPAVGSLIFFVLSNLGVWWEGLLYPRTAAGLLDCFVMAMPFYKYQMVFDGLVGGLALSGVAWIERRTVAAGRFGRGIEGVGRNGQ